MPPMNASTPRHRQEILERLKRRLPQMGNAFDSAAEPIIGRDFDSIDLVELLCVIESEFQVSLGDDDLAAASSAEKLAELIAQRLQQRRIAS